MCILKGLKRLQIAVLVLLVTSFGVALSGCGGAGAGVPSTSVAATSAVAVAPTAVTCSASPAQVVQGQPTTISAALLHASTPMTMRFSASAGQLSQSGNSATLASTGVDPGTVTVTCQAVDGTGSGASATTSIQVAAAPLTTSTTLTATQTAGTAGSPVALHATVLSSSVISDGSVSFLDGMQKIGTVTISAAGTASLTTTALAVGNHTISAAYSGTTALQASSSPSTTVSIEAPPVPPTVSCAALPSSVTAGQAATITASIASPSGRSTTVRFSTSAGVLTAQGSTASLNSSGLGSGVITVTCQVVDDLGQTASAVANVSVSAALSSTSLMLTSSSSPATSGKPLTLTALLTAVGGVPTGSVSFVDGGTVLGTANVSASGLATLVTSSLSTGTHVLSATYAGSAKLIASASAPMSLVVSEAAVAPTIACSASPSSITAGDLSTVVATANSLSNRAVTVHFSTSAGSLSQSGNSAILTSKGLPTGMVNIGCVATDDLGQTASASTSVAVKAPLMVTTTVLNATPNPATVGKSVTLTASVLGATSGSINFTDGGNSLGSAPIASGGTAVLTTSALSQGNHTLSASFGGDALTASSTSGAYPLVIAAAPLPPTIACSATPSSINIGDPATIVAMPNSASNRSLTLHFSSSAGSISQNGSTATLNSTGVAAGLVSISCQVTDDLGQIASASTSIAVKTRLIQTTTSIAANPNAAVVGQPVTLTGSVAGATAGTLNFSDGNQMLGSAAVSSSGGATLVTSKLTQGTHALWAAFTGTSTAATSSSGSVSLVVSPAAAPPTVACSAQPSSINPGDTATVIASAKSASNRSVSVSFATTTGTLSPNGGSAALNSAGAATGLAVITCNAVDDLGQTASATASVWINAGQGEQALTAFDFTDSIGVNIHLHFGNTPYVTNFPGLLNSMVDMGVTHYRNGVDPWAAPFEFANAEALAAVGIKGNWLIDTRDTAQNINDIVASAPHSVDAFEGPNEDDVNTGAVLSNFMQLLHDTVRSNPKTANLPIYGPTLVQFNSLTTQASVAANDDYASMHDYYFPRFPETPAYGANLFGCGAYGTMDFNICVAGVISPGHPVVSTETGYVSGTQSDEALGRYFPRILFGHLGKRVMRTYLYEMLENVDSPGYGLVRLDMTPKPGFYAIKSLITLFKDARFNTPGKLQYTLSGTMDNVQHVVFQKSDGTYMMAIWLGVASANPVAPYETYTITPQVVNIATQTPVGAASVSILDDEGHLTSSPVRTTNGATTVSINDRVTIVSFAPRNQ